MSNPQTNNIGPCECCSGDDPPTCAGDCSNPVTQPDTAVSGAGGLCDFLNGNFVWSHFQDGDVACVWVWDTGTADEVELSLNKSTGQVIVTIISGGFHVYQSSWASMEAAGLLCVDGDITGSVEVDADEDTCTGTATVTFG